MLQFFWRRLRRDERGFTLIELLIVVAIIAILAAILIPNFLRARRQAQVSATKGNMKNIGTALESYFVDKNAYPQDNTNTLNDVGLAPDYVRAVPTRPIGGTAYFYDVDTDPATNYVVCDDTTDTITNTFTTTWYYMPGGGLAGSTAALACSSITVP